MRVGIRTLQVVPLIGILHLVPIVDRTQASTQRRQALPSRTGWNEEFPGRRLSSVTQLWCDTAIRSLIELSQILMKKQASLAQHKCFMGVHNICFFVSGNSIPRNSDSEPAFFLDYLNRIILCSDVLVVSSGRLLGRCDVAILYGFEHGMHQARS
jgi:hypothetical protein